MKMVAKAPAPAPERKRAFPAFPFDPYPIQTDFMAFLYDSLEKGGVAMLESPTGTGKTLSIICSALQWLVDRRKTSKSAESGPTANGDGDGNGNGDEPDWMRDFVVESVEKKEVRRWKPGLGSRGLDTKTYSRGLRNLDKSKEGDGSGGGDDDAEFLLEEYESEEDSGSGGLKRKGRKCSDWSSSDEDEDGELGGTEEEEEEVSPKIYFTSRTHSQLSQFIHEFKKTSFASEINLICLGSRKNLCVHPEISKLGSANQINERCLELQKNQNSSKIKVASDGGRLRSRKASTGCPMLKRRGLRELFRNEVQEQGALDIEDLVKLGSKIGACPYYGSRDMIRAAELVVLPYQSLLLSSARESLGLNLKNSVIIIDEAHNLADSLTSMYSSKLTLSQLKQVHSHLNLYFERFRNRLGPANRRYIQTLIALTHSFLGLLLLGGHDDASTIDSCMSGKTSEEPNCSDFSTTINDFLFSLDIDNINLVKLHRYVKESNIACKVSGYGCKLISSERCPKLVNGHSNDTEGSIVSSFRALVDILLSLINNDNDGRIILSRQKQSSPGQVDDGYLKYVMLSGENIFLEIRNQAHAVVMVGGTLQPIEETRIRLFPDLLIDQVHFFSCNHIVPRESILPIAVSQGPSGAIFDFSYNSRSSASMMEELGRLLCNLVAVIPEGIVVFFSSFDYEGQVYDAWKTSGILSRILKRKRVFREPRNNVEVEIILKEYKEAILPPKGISKEDSGPHGAVLLAVVGGKISEGINLSDGLGRCIVMVGLPYPSPSDIELMERVKHIEGLGGSLLSKPRRSLAAISFGGHSITSGFEVLRSCKQRGREYYENLCMKAVNQSIGRAIRHINDYAAILLVDSRYSFSQPNISFSHPANKLPGWIKARLVSSAEGYGEVHRLLHQFFQFQKQMGIQDRCK